MRNGLEIDDLGNKYWYKDDLLHREDGPAIEYPSGDKFWFQNNERHREDGPAVIWNTGSKYWYYHNKHINCRSQEEFEKIIKLKAFW